MILAGRNQFQQKTYRRMFAVLIAIATGAIMAAGFSSSARSQNSLRIAATVNDEMISIFDINGRMTLAIFLAKLANSGETRRRLAPQILRSIIDDKLKMQEAKRQGITVTQIELKKELRDWERRTGLSQSDAANLSQRLGIDKSVIVEQVETSVAWGKLLESKYSRNIQFTEKEVDDIIKEEESRRGQPEFLVSEIYLPFSQDKDNRQVLALSERLVKQIQGGAAFPAVARNFSQSPTAAVGGTLGWVRRGQLPQQIYGVIERLRPRTISTPVRTLNGIYILKVLDKRAIEPFLKRSSAPATVTIYQIHLELPANAEPAKRAALQTHAAKIGGQAKNCSDMETLGKKFGTSLSGSPGKIEVDQLSSQIRNAISGLQKNSASQPIDINNGVLLVMVCERSAPTVEKIDRATFRQNIISRLITERLNLADRQLLRSLRRAAIVDVRI